MDLLLFNFVCLSVSLPLSLFLHLSLCLRLSLSLCSEWDMSVFAYLLQHLTLLLYVLNSSVLQTWSPDVTHQHDSTFARAHWHMHTHSLRMHSVCVWLHNMWRQFFTADSFSFEVESPLWTRWLLVQSSHIVAEQIFPSQSPWFQVECCRLLRFYSS